MALTEQDRPPLAPVAERALLGPAEVLQEAPLRVRLKDGREVELQLALTFPYAPRVGDVLLAISQDDEHFGIGVLSGQGVSSLAFQGDVDVRAVGGTLNLLGGEGVHLEAPKLTLRGETLRTFAGSITEKADTVFRWVKDHLTVRAGESSRVVQGEDYSQSENSVILAKETVKIDGHQLQLGH